MAKGFRLPGSSEAHDKAERNLMVAINKKFAGRCFLIHQHVGLFRQKNGRDVYIGVKGIPDIGGWVDGVAIQVEVKTGNAKRTEEQLAFAEMIIATGAVYQLATFSGLWGEDDEREVERVCRQLEQDTRARLAWLSPGVRAEADPDPRG